MTGNAAAVVAGVKEGFEACLGKARDFGVILACPLCRAACKHKTKLTHAG